MGSSDPVDDFPKISRRIRDRSISREAPHAGRELHEPQLLHIAAAGPGLVDFLQETPRFQHPREVLVKGYDHLVFC